MPALFVTVSAATALALAGAEDKVPSADDQLPALDQRLGQLVPGAAVDAWTVARDTSI